MKKINILGIFRELISSDNYDHNIVGVGQGNKYIRNVNTGKAAITILVKKKYPKSDLRRESLIPDEFDDLPTDIIEVGDIRLLNERIKYCRPAQPGMSLGHYKISAGTFGAVVKDKTTGELLILSNNHVLANITDGTDGRSSVGDAIIQPGTYDGGKLDDCTIAQLRRFVPLYRQHTTSRCKIARAFEMLLNKSIHVIRPNYRIQVLRESEKANLVDCAVAAPLNIEAINPEILEIGSISGIKEAIVNIPIKKSGRTTGLTYGKVLATNVTFQVGMNNQEYAIFTDQILAEPMSLPGDSGSLVLSDDNYAIGLLFAGSEQATMLNRIQHVLDKLNITFS